MIIKSVSNIKPLFGTDPEAAAVKKVGEKNYAIPPYFFRKFLGVPYTDPEGDMRHPVFFEEKEFKGIEDGANFEFTILPSHDPKELFDRIQECAKQFSERILKPFPEVCLPELQFLPTTDWDVERWQQMVKDNPEIEEEFLMSTEFGCDPDQDVFNLEAKCRVIDASLHPERYCGGHFHASGSKMIAEDPHLAVKCMATTVGLAALAFSDVRDLEYRRLFLYGRPGRFRVQNYGERNKFGPDYAIGIEYRTPSARWAGKWEIAKEVLKWAEIGIKNLLETSLGLQITREIIEPTVEAIMNANQKQARELLSYVESKI